MAINKVTYSGNTLIDLTADTVDAEHLAEGYTAHNAAGAIITGTMTGGGSSGLPPFTEVETGTWSPTYDIANTTIVFGKAHSNPPVIVELFDAQNDNNTTTNTLLGLEIIDVDKLLGASIPYASSYSLLASVVSRYRSTSTSSSTVAAAGSVRYGSSNTTSSTAAYYRFWANTSYFRAYGGNSNRYWRTGRTYKWIALWID